MLEELPKQYQKQEVLVCKLQDDQITRKDVAIIQDHPHLQLERKLFQIVYQMLQKIIVNLQTEERIGIIICDHQARDLLTCVDIAMILSNCKIIAQGTPKDLINNPVAQNAYFGKSFKIN